MMNINQMSFALVLKSDNFKDLIWVLQHCLFIDGCHSITLYFNYILSESNSIKLGKIIYYLTAKTKHLNVKIFALDPTFIEFIKSNRNYLSNHDQRLSINKIQTIFSIDNLNLQCNFDKIFYVEKNTVEIINNARNSSEKILDI